MAIIECDAPIWDLLFDKGQQQRVHLVGHFRNYQISRAVFVYITIPIYSALIDIDIRKAVRLENYTCTTTTWNVEI